MRLAVNNQRFEVTSREELREALAWFTQEQFREIWLHAPDDFPAISALANGTSGWLMYLREAGDAGFSSRNPAYDGKLSARLSYRLSNGQIDEYPASWAIPEVELFEALAYFVEHTARPPFVTWHDDA